MSTDRELNREKILTIFEEYCHDSSAHRLEVAVNKHLDLLTEATHEAEAEALKKGLDLAWVIVESYNKIMEIQL